MRQAHMKQKNRGIRWGIFFLLLLLLVGVLALRAHPMGADQPADDAIPATPTWQPPAATEEPPPASPAAVPAESPAPETPAPEMPTSTQTPQRTKTKYTEKTYTLVSDMVYTYKTLQREDGGEVERMLTQLKAEDPGLGAVWEQIMATWDAVRHDLTITPNVLPDGLPEDDSLGIVVMGFQLLADGTMTPELTGRCEVALACAQKYPNAFVVVTGGGTARDNHLVTEASVMAEWLKNHGVDESRIVREDTSMTSIQNAQNTCAILTERYPQVKSLAMVSSDYHIPMVTLLFTEAAILHAYACGSEELPYTVVSNAAFATAGDEEYTSANKQAQYLWVMAAPDY